MRSVEPAPETTISSIEETNLDTVTGGCAIGGCVGGGCASGAVRYSYHASGFGIDPMFMMLAFSLLGQNNK